MMESLIDDLLNVWGPALASSHRIVVSCRANLRGWVRARTRARARAYMLLCVLGHLDASDSPPAVAAAGRARASVARHLAGPVGTQLRSSEAGRERRIQKCLGLIGTPAPQPVPRTASTLPVSAGVHRRSVVECMAACSTDLVLDVHQTMPCDLRKPTCAVTEQRHRKHGMCRSKQKKGAP